MSPANKTVADDMIRSNPLLRPILFATGPLAAWHSALCLIVWLGSFTVFAYFLEDEAHHYQLRHESTLSHQPVKERWISTIVTIIACVSVLPLFHFSYMYDPPTLAFSILALRAIRKEKLLQLVLITALFSFNRETAFIVPAMTFLFWIHRGQLTRGVLQATLLSAVYIAVAGTLIYLYRRNAGVLANFNFRYLMHEYLHEKLHYAIGAAVALGAYAIAVIQHWKTLPPALKSVQWLILPWIAMHLIWGWPMEWRVFFEIYPGVVLTIVALVFLIKDRAKFMKEGIARSHIPIGIA